MDRALATVFWLLVAVVALPAIAQAAQAAVPTLIGVLFFLAVARLGLRPSRRR